jgi:hypothetical protein
VLPTLKAAGASEWRTAGSRKGLWIR